MIVSKTDRVVRRTTWPPGSWLPPNSRKYFYSTAHSCSCILDTKVLESIGLEHIHERLSECVSRSDRRSVKTHINTTL